MTTPSAAAAAERERPSNGSPHGASDGDARGANGADARALDRAPGAEESKAAPRQGDPAGDAPRETTAASADAGAVAVAEVNATDEVVATNEVAATHDAPPTHEVTATPEVATTAEGAATADATTTAEGAPTAADAASPEPEDVVGSLTEVRRELAELHATATRTQGGLTALATSLRDVVLRQERYERGLNLNSFVAYLLFTVLLGSGFFFLYRSRADHLVEERDAALEARETATQSLAASRKELGERDASARKAAEFWTLLREGRNAEAVAGYAAIAELKLTPTESEVFQDAVARARAQIVDSGYAAGLDAFRGRQWKRAADELRRALNYENDGPRAAQMRYYLGVALSKQGENEAAVKQLELAIAGGAERDVGSDARFHMAATLAKLRQLDRARNEYVRFADTHPRHPLMGAARRRARALAREMRALQ